MILRKAAHWRQVGSTFDQRESYYAESSAAAENPQATLRERGAAGKDVLIGRVVSNGPNGANAARLQSMIPLLHVHPGRCHDDDRTANRLLRNRRETIRCRCRAPVRCSCLQTTTRQTIRISISTIGPPVMQRRNCFSPGRAHSRAHNSRRMAGTWRTTRTNPAATRSTSGRFHRVRGNGRCR